MGDEKACILKGKGPIRRKAGRFLIVLPWLLLLPFVIHLLLFDGWKDVTIGRLARKAGKVFYEVSDVSKVEMFRILDDDTESEPESFFSNPSGGSYRASNKIELTGENLREFLNLWSRQEIIPGMNSMCHSPAYGVRLIHTDGKQTETTLCWECSNFGVEVYPGLAGTFYFQADEPVGRQLLRLCDRKLPVLKKKFDEPLRLEDFPKTFTSPKVTMESPGPGKRVKQWLPEYEGTELYHTLYLPTDWEAEKKYPVIVEYSGNQYKGSQGTVDECDLGYGITGGKQHILVSLPYVAEDGKRNEGQWWGNIEATVAYCKETVPLVCREYGGNPDMVFLAGFSRGAIACNYIGLHDDEISRLWCGFICHSHYDGVKQWNYPDSDRESAKKRLDRLKGRPQYISHEMSVESVDDYLWEMKPQGNFTFAALPFDVHTDEWVLYDHEWRNALRQWLLSKWVAIEFEQEQF